MSCDPLPDVVASQVREFWEDKATLPDLVFRTTHLSLRKAIVLAPPTSRQGVVRQMRTDMYVEASRAARAYLCVCGLRRLVYAMLRGEAPVPAGAEWAMDPSLWNMDAL